MYACMSLFFQNGGGACYVVSVGEYGSPIVAKELSDPLIPLEKEQEPTLIVIPEAVRLAHADCNSLQQAVLNHCGKMKNRFGVLDLWDGWRDQHDSAGNMVDLFRDSLATNFAKYGAAYYPWLETTIYTARDVNFTKLDKASRAALSKLLVTEAGLGDVTLPGGSPPPPPPAPQGGNEDTPPPPPPPAPSAKLTPKQLHLQAIRSIEPDWTGSDDDRDALDNMLRATSGICTDLTGHLAAKLNLLPPSSAMVGIYTMVDATRGVWKAPANVVLSSVVAPSVNISNEEQENLNVTPMGKSINAIRPFIGEGVLVWGARTLDGNSLDWRYINVRRTMIMIEESVRLAAKAYVFEPNTANTWVTVKGMISNFLNGIWKAGGLAGAVPEDAFSVHVGLGETMTPNDILEGIMRVTVLLAPTRPAEFIEITFQQQQQRS